MRTLIDLERTQTGRFRLRVRRESDEGKVDVVGSVEGNLDSARRIAKRALGHWALIDEVEAMAARSAPSTRRRKNRKSRR